MITTQKIQIITEYIQKGVEKANAIAKKTNENITRQQRSYENATRTGKRHIESVRNNMMANSRAGQVMRMNAKDLGKYNEMGRKFNTTGARTANKFRMMTHGARGFRMEMLGVMFFGMMLQRAFSGLIKTSLEWMGVTEIFSQVLGILFLPVAEWFLDIVLLLLKWVTSLTESQKKWIGAIVVLGIVLGGALYIIGTFALGIGSMIMAFGGLLLPIGLVIGAFVAIAGFLFLKDYFKTLGDSTDELGEKLQTFGLSATMFENLGGVIKDLITKIITWVSANIGRIMETGLSILTAIIEGISQNADKIGEALEEIISAMGRWIGENSERFVSIGLSIAGLIIKGIAKGLWSLGVGIGNVISDNIMTNAHNRLGYDFPGYEPVKDFILQPGGKLIKTDPNDTIMGSKSGFGGGVTISPTYYVNVSDKREFEAMLVENNRQLTEDVRRTIQV